MFEYCLVNSPRTTFSLGNQSHYYSTAVCFSTITIPSVTGVCLAGGFVQNLSKPFNDAPHWIWEELLSGHMRVTATWGCLRNDERTWSCPGNRWNEGLPWQKRYRNSFSKASLCFFRQIAADMTVAVLIKIPKRTMLWWSQTCSYLFIFTHRLNPPFAWQIQIHMLMVVAPVSLLGCSCVYVHAAK